MLLLARYTPNKSLTCIGILNASRQFAALLFRAQCEPRSGACLFRHPENAEGVIRDRYEFKRL